MAVEDSGAEMAQPFFLSQASGAAGSVRLPTNGCIQASELKLEVREKDSRK
jgi:hypothetical protein